MSKQVRSLLAFAVWLGCAVPVGAQAAPVRTITQVAGNLFKAQEDNHITVFVVTPDGIILSDPLNSAFAIWLKSEFSSRFRQPVKYVLYTHHHWDHASGGAVFADTAEFVGHEAMPAKLAMPAASTPLPADAARLDRNGDGRIQSGEAEGELKSAFSLFDVDADGTLSGAEVARGPLREVYPPRTLYRGRKTIAFGGETVEMIHVGPVHAEDMTVLRFPGERAVFLVDFISLKRLPYRNLPGYNPTDVIGRIKDMEALDFDIAVPGHGLVGNKGDVAAHRRYLEELGRAVAEGIAAGKSLAELQKAITMEAYRGWINYKEWLPENIAGMYAVLTRGVAK